MSDDVMQPQDRAALVQKYRDYSHQLRRMSSALMDDLSTYPAFDDETLYEALCGLLEDGTWLAREIAAAVEHSLDRDWRQAPPASAEEVVVTDVDRWQLLDIPVEQRMVTATLTVALKPDGTLYLSGPALREGIAAEDVIALTRFLKERIRVPSLRSEDPFADFVPTPVNLLDDEDADEL